MVLDRDNVRVGSDGLLGQPQVVVERLELLARVVQITNITQRNHGDRGVAGGADCVDCGRHLANAVEGIEDAEDVDVGARRFLYSGIRDTCQLGRVVDSVAVTQQHLQR